MKFATLLEQNISHFPVFLVAKREKQVSRFFLTYFMPVFNP